jgi:hypothetical protein
MMLQGGLQMNTKTYSDKQIVNKFLGDVRDAVANDKMEYVPRQKNEDTLADLNLTKEDAIRIASTLTYAEYRHGPNDDQDKPGSGGMWIFKILLGNNGPRLYIKIKDNYANEDAMKLMSFHFDK